MLDIALQILSLVSSSLALYLCSSTVKNAQGRVNLPRTQGQKRLGCMVGALIATPVNIVLTINCAPAVLALSVICGVVYIHGADFGELFSRLKHKPSQPLN